MTREEIIYEIRCLLFELDNGEDAVSYLTQNDVKWLKENIKALEQEPKWIPVTERLPETNDDVLTTDGVDMFVAWYARNSMWQGWMSSDNNFERNTPIDAWMPLPQPYKGGQEDGKGNN